MKSDVFNAVYALLFVIISLFTWCAISFKLADGIWGEEKLFSNKKNAILTYAVSIFIAIIMTIAVYWLINFL